MSVAPSLDNAYLKIIEITVRRWNLSSLKVIFVYSVFSIFVIVIQRFGIHVWMRAFIFFFALQRVYHPRI